MSASAWVVVAPLIPRGGVELDGHVGSAIYRILIPRAGGGIVSALGEAGNA